MAEGARRRVAFGLEPDGRWHRPPLYPTGLLRVGGHCDEWWQAALERLPLRRDVGRYRMGQAPIEVSLFVEGRGWVAGQRVWVDAFTLPAGQTLHFDSPVGRMEVYVRAGRHPRLMQERPSSCSKPTPSRRPPSASKKPWPWNGSFARLWLASGSWPERPIRRSEVGSRGGVAIEGALPCCTVKEGDDRAAPIPALQAAPAATCAG